MFRFFFFAFFLFSLAGCQSGDSRGKDDTPEADAPEEAPPPVDPDALLLRLSADLVADPATPAERDRNAIVNYAIDNLLDVQSTPSGLYYQVLRPGGGERLQWGDRVRVHYRGHFLDGKTFDSSYRRDQPLEFYIGNMIDGWNEGLQLLRPGAKARLLVPARLGYGEEGLKSGEKVLVPPDKVLVFEVEVLEKVDG